MSASVPASPIDHRPAGGASARRAFAALEHGCDHVFGERDNPLRQLGGLGFYLFWLIALTGAYLYIFYDTSVDGAYASVDRLARDQPWAGGVMRSLHRYASDAFLVVCVLHLVRELAYGRFRGFRWYSWVSGVPTLWLAVASGVVGYWLVWDDVALFVATASTEWFGVLPGFGAGLVRNFVTDAAVSDRFFSLAIFLHIGLPLALLLTMWAHVQRLTRPRTGASRAVALWTLGALLVASIVVPAASGAPADAARVAVALPIDWFYLAPLVAIYPLSSATIWALALGATLVLAVAPWLRAPVRAPAAVVDPEHCNGCTRCFVDCPYAAVAMAPHPSGRGRIAVVDADRCAACGLCAGACPSSTPFRSGERLVTGIDLPAAPVAVLRDAIDAALARTRASRLGEARRADAARTPAGGPLLVFACACGAAPSPAPGSDVVALPMPCAGMLPPSFVEYALRSGARGVVVATCRTGDCEYRFGDRWTEERIAGAREPRLRAGVDRRTVLVVPAAPGEAAVLDAAIARLDAQPPAVAQARLADKIRASEDIDD